MFSLVVVLNQCKNHKSNKMLKNNVDIELLMLCLILYFLQLLVNCKGYLYMQICKGSLYMVMTYEDGQKQRSVSSKP